MIETFFLTLVIILFFSVSLVIRGLPRRTGLPDQYDRSPGSGSPGSHVCGSGAVRKCDGCRKSGDR